MTWQFAHAAGSLVRLVWALPSGYLLASMAEPTGALMGTRYAASFEVFSLGFPEDD